MRQALIELIYRSATRQKRVRLILTPVGGLFFFLLVALFLVAGLLTDKVLGLPRLTSHPVGAILSVALLACGAYLMAASALRFLTTGGTPVPFNPPPKLVTSGPYAHIRNPMTGGLAIFVFGLGLLFRSIAVSLIFTPLLVILIVLELKLIEEPELERRLGDDYIRYKNRTPMFLPRFGSRGRTGTGGVPE